MHPRDLGPYNAFHHMSGVQVLLFLCSLIFTNCFFHNLAGITNVNMCVYTYKQYVVLDVFLITDPRTEDSTALDLKSSISCVMNKWAIIVCLSYLSTTPLCAVPCMLCRHVLVVVTTERSSVPATISHSEGRIIHGSFTIVSARG